MQRLFHVTSHFQVDLNVLDVASFHSPIGMVTCLSAMLHAAFPMAMQVGVVATVVLGKRCPDGYIAFWLLMHLQLQEL